MGATIVGISGTYRGAEFHIEGGLTFGRDPVECNVVINDNSGIDLKHCRVQELGGRIYLTDLGSMNGTFLSNGRKLSPQQPVELHPGDVFYLADTGEQFQVKGDPLQTIPTDNSRGRENPFPPGNETKKKYAVIVCIVAVIVLIIVLAVVGSRKKEPLEATVLEDREENSIVGVWEIDESYFRKLMEADEEMEEAYREWVKQYGEEDVKNLYHSEFEFTEDGEVYWDMPGITNFFVALSEAEDVEDISEDSIIAGASQRMTLYGEYEIDGSSIEIIWDYDGEKVREKGHYRIKDDKLILTFDGETMEYKRK